MSGDNMSNRQIDSQEEMREEYDFSGGVRGKHYEAYRRGHTILVHKSDGTTETRSSVGQSLLPVLDIQVPRLDPAPYVATWQRVYGKARQVSHHRQDEAERSRVALAAAQADLSNAATKEEGELARQRANQAMSRYEFLWANRRYEYQHFYTGWSGLAFRLASCAKQNRIFTQTLRLAGGDATGQDLYRQDEALFGFCTSALSALECLHFSLYAAAALVRPDEFPHVSPENTAALRQVSVATTVKSFQAAFPDDAITARMISAEHDPEYRDLKTMRNILAHRAASAGRDLHYTDLPATPEIGGEQRQHTVKLWAGQNVINERTTNVPYDWVVNTINDLVRLADEWSAKYFED
jgi:hypothetical protein